MSRGSAPDPRLAHADSIRVFLSSPFEDTRQERDHLTRRVFPRLEALAERRRVEINAVDLRWGVSDRPPDIIPSCLAQVDLCQPFFVGILGDRYGTVLPASERLLQLHPWLGEHAGASVTEIEMRSVLRRGPDGAPFSFFYLRKESGADPRVVRLRADIRESGFPVRAGFSTPDELGALVLRDLTDAIERVAPPAPESERARLRHAGRASRLARRHVQQPDLLAFLDRHANGGGAPLMLIGEPGAGKSTLLAAWTERHLLRHPEVTILLDLVGVDADSLRSRPMLRRFWGELAAAIPACPPAPAGDLSANALAAGFVEVLRNLPKSRRVVIVVDDVDRLDDSADGGLAWLATPPPHVRVVLSALPVPGNDVARRHGWQVLAMRLMSAVEARTMIDAHLARHGRGQRPARLVLDDGTAWNPSFVRTVLGQALLCGHRDELDGRLATLLGFRSVARLQQHLIGVFRDDYDREHRGWVDEALKLLWAAPTGLAESEVRALSARDGEPVPAEHWSPLYVALTEGALAATERMSLSVTFRRAVERELLSDPAERLRIHGVLARFFDAQPDADRRARELPRHLAEAERWRELAGFVSDRAALDRLWSQSPEDVIRWVGRLEVHGYDVPELLQVDDEQLNAADPTRLERSARILEALGHVRASDSLWQRRREGGRGGDNDAQILHHQIGLLGERREWDAAARKLDDLRALCRSKEPVPPLWQARLASCEARILRGSGRPEEALDLYRQAARLALEAGDWSEVFACRNGEGITLSELGRQREALSTFAGLRRLCELTGTASLLQEVMGNEGLVSFRLGEHEIALRQLTGAEEIARQGGMVGATRRHLLNQLALHAALGDQPACELVAARLRALGG